MKRRVYNRLANNRTDSSSVHNSADKLLQVTGTEAAKLRLPTDVRVQRYHKQIGKRRLGKLTNNVIRRCHTDQQHKNRNTKAEEFSI